MKLLPSRVAQYFPAFLSTHRFGNKRTHGTRQRPPAIHLQTRNDLADDIRRGRIDFTGKFFGDVRVRQAIGLALIIP